MIGEIQTMLTLHETNYCFYVEDNKTNVLKLWFKPDGQELDVSNYEIILRDNGLEFV